jgi:hypothetical protein
MTNVSEAMGRVTEKDARGEKPGAAETSWRLILTASVAGASPVAGIDARFLFWQRKLIVRDVAMRSIVSQSQSK